MDIFAQLDYTVVSFAGEMSADAGGVASSGTSRAVGSSLGIVLVSEKLPANEQIKFFSASPVRPAVASMAVRTS